MNSSDFEIFHNWNNSINTNDKIQYRKIQAQIEPLKNKKVYSNSEIEEILIAEGYKQNLIKEALKEDQPEEAVVEKTVTVPKRYADLSHKFEKVLQDVGPSKFVNLMTRGQSPLLKLSKKEIDTLTKIADTAYENPVHLATLHAFMQPSIVSELAENVCRARKIRSNCTMKKVSSGTYKITHANKTVEASINPISSNSDKFSKSNYDKFSFPDEYIIMAYEEESPYAQIKRDLASK